MDSTTAGVHSGTSRWLRFILWLPLGPKEDTSRLPEEEHKRRPPLRDETGASNFSAVPVLVDQPPQPLRADEIDARMSPKLPQVLSDEAASFVNKIELDILDDCREAKAANEVTPAPGAVQTCLRLARLIAPHTALAPGLEYAAFAEETGDVSIVLHSFIADRRVNFRISADAGTISAVTIDEKMTVVCRPVSFDTGTMLRGLTAWVTNRA